MLVYACLILLPAAAALTFCDKETLLLFFDKIDLNKNGKVERTEADDVAKRIDVSNDTRITVDEAREALSAVEPRLKGKEDFLFNFFDLDKSGDVTSADVDAIFRLVDLDNDGANAKEEFLNFLEKICIF
ncbi:unnamed protein product [Candidula unifasciata]|uniref:EF-hand domain-containing protein n=1 Tax=Candidula unifasciata TaxID=100452 RepID=A0A8S3ZAQ4_9EUPU|nr:unnamed protein product [Candidula unifasciata]